MVYKIQLNGSLFMEIPKHGNCQKWYSVLDLNYINGGGARLSLLY